MPRVTHHEPHLPGEPQQTEGVVRTATAIPTIDRPTPAAEQAQAQPALACSGHCGRCQVDPCQLHAKLAFRI